MPRRTKVFRGVPRTVRPDTTTPADERRGSAYKRGYDATWVKLRRMHLSGEPYCRMCKANNKLTIGRVVDHVIPHKGNRTLLLDPNNLQTLCDHHHNSVKQSWERAPHLRQWGADGYPIK